MYAKGIVQIYMPPKHVCNLVMAKHWADNAGSNSFCFDNSIYIKSTGGRVGRAWIKTNFTLDDFKVVL